MPSLLDQFPIRRGTHTSPDDGMSAMELVAWLAGESHTAGPRSASPVITAFVGSFNDVIPSDAGRNYYLRSWIPRLVNTQGDEAVEDRRASIVIDFMVRTLLPLSLEKDGRTAAGRELAMLKPIRTRTSAILAGLAVQQESGHRRVAAAIRLATRDRPPSAWVPVAARLIEEVGTPRAFEMGTRLIHRLVQAGRKPLGLPSGS
jgi:hypothetical protein